MRIYRKDSMMQTAGALKMQYQERDEWGFINQLKDFKLFNKGGRRRIKHQLIDKDNVSETEKRIFDYHYTISTGKSSRKFRQTVFFIQSPHLGLPHFFMRPEHFFHQVGEWLGYKDIDFEAYPTFSKNYFLTGQDEEFIRANMNDKVLNFFTLNQGWHLEGVNYYMILYKKNKIFTPQQIQDLFKKGDFLFEKLRDQYEF